MSIKRTKPLFSLADQLFNRQTVRKLSEGIASSDEGFDSRKFEREVLREFPALELKARISCLVDALESHLPGDFDRALAILTSSLPEPLDPGKTDDDFGEYIWVVPSEYVARHGCTPDRLHRSHRFLQKATMRFSAEAAIRPFLKSFPEKTLDFVHECAAHENYHVRRLASEGIRPYLPWAEQVVLPLQDIVSVLNRLHADSTRYVTRSVANTLNDLSKDHPGAVIDILKSWSETGLQETGELLWMTRHALRTLVKSGHADALEFLGYPAKPKFTVSDIEVAGTVAVGSSVRWRCLLASKIDQKLKIALRVHFLKADGTHSNKVFAVKDTAMLKGERLSIDKAISFKPISTRTLYPGVHHVELVVNGVARGKRSFRLVA